ncbi:sequence-specific DNA-binding high mobility group box protein, partial [Neoconidiobolus thromboides FSU 785]
EKKKHIPRPKNCFMTYRQAKMEDILKAHGKINNKDISKLAGEMWNQEPEIIKEHFRKLAELGKIEHAKKYPNYKYCPRKN